MSTAVAVEVSRSGDACGGSKNSKLIEARVRRLWSARLGTPSGALVGIAPYWSLDWVMPRRGKFPSRLSLHLWWCHATHRCGSLEPPPNIRTPQAPVPLSLWAEQGERELAATRSSEALSEGMTEEAAGRAGAAGRRAAAGRRGGREREPRRALVCLRLRSARASTSRGGVVRHLRVTPRAR